MHNYDAIIIGAGQAGPSLAGALVAQGKRVALAEGHKIGGSCVNYGCIPTKTLIASAKVARQIQRSAEYGIQVGEVKVDFAAVMARMNQRRGDARSGLEAWLEGMAGLDLYRTYAQFDGQDAHGNYRVQVGEEVISAPQVFLNVGTRAFIPPIEGIDGVPYLDSEGILALTELPQHLLILGGSYIGLELGLAFRRLGAQVSIIENNPRLIAREDEDISAEAQAIVEAEGVRLYLGHQAIHAQTQDAGLSLTLQDAVGGRTVLSGSHLLVAVGRKANSERLNLSSVGIEVDKRGFIPVGEGLETTARGIYALGDVNGRGAFTHTSYQEYQIVLDNLNGAQRRVSERTLAYALYLDPPLGRVGMSESEVRASGRPALIAKKAMNQIGRALEQGETRGFIKLLVDAETERFLGAAVFGYQGDDVVQIISNFMATGASYRVMRDALPIHPTIGEFLPSMLNELQVLS